MSKWLDGKICCPDCGSEQAVAKWAAWDALAEIPPKTAEELARLRRISDAARAVVDDAQRPQFDEVVFMHIPMALIEKLSEAINPTPPEDTQ